MTRETLPDTDVVLDVEEDTDGDLVATDEHGVRWYRNRAVYPNGDSDTYNPANKDVPLAVRFLEARERARGR